MSLKRSIPWLALMALALAVPAARAGDEKPLLDLKGQITTDDPKDKELNRHCKEHTIALEAGKTYRIDMVSREVDSLMRLLGPDGNQVAFDDDGGGFPNARIIYKAAKSGDHKLIATTFNDKVGAYSLTVRLASKADLLIGRIQSIGNVGAQERDEIIADFTKHLKSLGGKITFQEVQLAFSAAQALEARDAKAAGKAYEDFGKVLGESTDPKVAQVGKTFEGCTRRLNLMGNTMQVKGKTLDGKELDLAALKGKVVLVDFWATWCGPCLGEFPNMQKMHEAYNKRGFEILAISVDANKQALANFLEKRKLPWESIHDPREPGRTSLSDYYGVISIPLAILVDREGRVISMNARGGELTRLLARELGPNDSDKK